ncbi:tRNA lysidine(34) synthetase TilS [Kordiimonas pumila]|uniref:tRNA(Ile)-lysidine synthase n=1 Tax=Kordiimonas pumila TaxID=2161677 RepID=A0ABV7D820_9PROT|nr:tRNA lysidine(34) synthetase TilS [Kordiimonas pumila]
MITKPPITRENLIDGYCKLGVDKGTKIAIAVSGGADSLCLLLLSRFDYKVTAITVDHGLRKEAAEEASFVAALCAEYSIPHVTLRWQGDKPTANLQAAAREARYDLIKNWCVEKGIETVAVAHHQDDQAETVLLRLARGSGVYGLAGMAPVRSIGQGVSLVRPLLEYPKESLIRTVKDMGIKWVEDPSNRSEAYDRVKIRKMLANPPVEGLNAARLAGTAGRLRRSRDALEYYERQWLLAAVHFYDEGYCTVDTKQFKDAPEEIILRALASICRFVSGGTYVPRMEKILRLYSALQEGEFKGQTLYGAMFSPLSEHVALVTREVSAISTPVALESQGIWDLRFWYQAQGNISGLTIAPVGENGWIQLKNIYKDMKEFSSPRLAILAMPALFDGEQLRSVPFLGYDTLKDVSFSFSREGNK